MDSKELALQSIAVYLSQTSDTEPGKSNIVIGIIEKALGKEWNLPKKEFIDTSPQKSKYEHLSAEEIVILEQEGYDGFEHMNQPRAEEIYNDGNATCPVCRNYIEHCKKTDSCPSFTQELAERESRNADSVITDEPLHSDERGLEKELKTDRPA